ncbi:hypothetical protein POM88_051953 [Heracleum sosnowskyi]|nr:hypothetical protein POM88_051949 [Heracleum sosnowskyi]KAK1353586.1 hypothetical protein POM88_051951 [Heracleum sosnowskyi]KAK1353588.1 hypothetical protein POM88_051953 [Heracleum sosnowskyi]
MAANDDEGLVVCITGLLSDPYIEPEHLKEATRHLLNLCEKSANLLPILRNKLYSVLPNVLMFWLGKVLDDDQPMKYTMDVTEACFWMLLVLPSFNYPREDNSIKELFHLSTSIIKSPSKFKVSDFCFFLLDRISILLKREPRLLGEILECFVFLEGVLDLFQCESNLSGRVSLWRIIRLLFKNTRNTQLASVLNRKVKLLEVELIVFRVGRNADAKEIRTIQKAVKEINDYLIDVPQYNTGRLSCCINKYGVSNRFEVFNDEYARCVYSVIYTETDIVMEDHAENIIKTKNSLGIDAINAALLHMEIARPLVIDILASGDPDGNSDKHQAFKNLLFVSNMVFGELASSLLPWTRVFDVTASQVEQAVRDKAWIAYDFSLTLVGRDIDAGKLITLREKQQKYRLSDELAEELFKRHTRKLVKENISAALRELKTAQTSKELDKILDFNSQLIKFGKHPDASRFARGLGTICLLDGERDDDMKLLFRRYVLDSLSGVRIEETKRAALNQLGNIFGICEREAKAIIVESALQLFDQISARDLKAAASQAEFPSNPPGSES